MQGTTFGKGAGGRTKGMKSDAQSEMINCLTTLKIPPTEYNIDLILPKGGELNREAFQDLLVKNGKTQPEADRLVELMVQMQMEAPNGPATQEFNHYVKAKPLEVHMQNPEVEKASAPTRNWLEVELVKLEKKEQDALKRGDREGTAAVAETMQVFLVKNVVFIEEVRKRHGDTAAEDAQRALLGIVDECLVTGIPPFEYAKEDKSQSKNPLHHLTELQARLATETSEQIAAFFKKLKDGGATENELVPIANTQREALVVTLQANALLRGSEPENYEAFLLTEHKIEREEILLNSGFTPQTIQYFENTASASMAAAFTGIGLSILAGAILGQEISGAETSIGAQAAAAQAQMMKDIQELAREDGERAEDAKKLIDELRKQESEAGTVGELKTELADKLEKMGISKDATIKEAVEFMNNIIAQNTTVAEVKKRKVEVPEGSGNWAGPFSKDPGEVLDQNGTAFPPPVMATLVAKEFNETAFIALRGDADFTAPKSPEAIVMAYPRDAGNSEKQKAAEKVLKNPQSVALRAAFLEALASVSTNLSEKARKGKPNTKVA